MVILGRHLLVELFECDRLGLADVTLVERSLLAAADRAHATVLSHHFHRFEPQGVSGVVVIAESHLSIHTWPEHGYAAADIFTCGPDMRPEEAVRTLVDAFDAQHHQVTEIRRGFPATRPTRGASRPAPGRG